MFQELFAYKDQVFLSSLNNTRRNLSA